MCETLSLLPSKFSTFLLAMHHSDLHKELTENKGMTLFVPGNNAWMNLGLRNMMYLFSEEGKKDLKKVMQYHVSLFLISTTRG
jgi:uncharacterized surface protein with fasciclin (FAS1) repeats